MSRWELTGKFDMKRPSGCRGPLPVYICFHFVPSFVLRDSKEILKKSFCVEFTP